MGSGVSIPETQADARKAGYTNEEIAAYVEHYVQVEMGGKTAAELAEIIDDLKLAVEEGEPELAGQIFKNIQGFVAEMRQRAKSLMEENGNLMLKLNYTCEAALQRRLPNITDAANTGSSRKSNEIIYHTSAPKYTCCKRIEYKGV